MKYTEISYREKQKRYQSLVKKAWKEYKNGNHSEMATFLKDSLYHSPYRKAETISHWISEFGKYSLETNGDLDIDFLSELFCWQDLMHELTKIDAHAHYSIKLQKQLQFIKFSIQHQKNYQFKGNCFCQKEENPKAAIAIIRYLDRNGKIITKRYEGLDFSKELGDYYQYIRASKDGENAGFNIFLLPPANATQVDIGFQLWNSQEKTCIISDLNFQELKLNFLDQDVKEQPKIIDALYQTIAQQKEGIETNKVKELVDLFCESYEQTANPEYLNKAANLLYHKLGDISSSQKILETLEDDNGTNQKATNLALMIRAANHILTKGVQIPKLQPNPLYKPQLNSVMYCLDSSIGFTTNGYATRSHGICCGVMNMGWHIAPVTRPGYPWDKSPVIVQSKQNDFRIETEKDGIRYTALNTQNLNSQIIDAYMEISSDLFLREAIKQGVEIIHSASNYYTALPALIAARRLGLPFIYEVRGLWEVTQASKIEGWEQSDRYKLAVAMETLVATEADRVVAITEELKAELIRRGVKGEKISVIPNCVDVDIFCPISKDEALAKKIGLSLNIPTIGFAGSLVDYEGLDLLIEALALLAEENIPFNLLIVGDGSCLPHLQTIAAQYQIQDRCYFVGRVPFEQVSSYISLMDIMPCPRKSMAVTEMVSPLKPLESMAMGKAILLSDVAPHITLVQENVTGMLFQKDNPVDLAEKLKLLLSAPELRKTLGKNARNWVVENRTWRKAGEMFASVYHAVRTEVREAQEQLKTEGKVKKIKDIKLAVISDRFTFDAISRETQIFAITPENWHETFTANAIDAVLIESAWEGNNGAWHRKVGKYEDREFKHIRELLEHCRKGGIPTIFWNKEDPVHFQRFKVTASLCSTVFTTDANQLGAYRSLPNNQIQSFGALPFFVQPKIHNPLNSRRENSHTICYAGTYYGKRYADRTVELDLLLKASRSYGLTIYDRQFDKPDSPYRFPEDLSAYIRGALDYSEMVEAYKAHPVNLNVNSVKDSPTMFSRRVVEAIACGSAVVSGSGQAVAPVLNGLVPTVTDKTSAEQLLKVLMTDELWRRNLVAQAARYIFSRHTTGHRLAQMLRTANLCVEAPGLPRYALIIPSINKAIATQLTKQSLLPTVVLTSSCDQDTEKLLKQVGCETVQTESKTNWPETLKTKEVEWIGVFDSEKCYSLTFYEDLLNATLYSDRSVLGSVAMQSKHWQGERLPFVTLEDHPQTDEAIVKFDKISINSSLGVNDWVKSIQNIVASSPALCLIEANNIKNSFRRTETPGAYAVAKGVGTILVAGHDLKFIRKIVAQMERQGYRILIDQWQGHREHNQEMSEFFLKQADIVFCEWLLGNAIWYSHHKHPEQKLIGRLHLQEAQSQNYLPQINFSAFERIIFVGPHIMRQVQTEYSLDSKKCVLIPNAVETVALDRSKIGDFRNSLGIVGIVPQRKRLDLALDILEKLRSNNSAFQLYIKGKRPEDYPWMRDRPDEMVYYQTQYDRIESNPLLKGSVHFEGWGDDMPDWYRKIGFVLSVSDYESFHLSVADGAASGAIPIVLPWEGAKEIYPKNWISKSIQDAVEKISLLSLGKDLFIHQASLCKPYAQKEFNLELIAEKFIELFQDS
ncbi:glycosyltransferase [Okeania sp. SIO1I7]|uniref:glycosyltransferase n=1 Tax=Okeania sp. SIO1I7 TaxID=2607772 RepID=UPI0013F928E7|nr:glycosyltransferase [Okeania sp. SIO1I7]NET24733.1 glycosyltransferase [Okeania sp. SIO1I7]